MVARKDQVMENFQVPYMYFEHTLCVVRVPTAFSFVVRPVGRLTQSVDTLR